MAMSAWSGCSASSWSSLKTITPSAPCSVCCPSSRMLSGPSLRYRPHADVGQLIIIWFAKFVTCHLHLAELSYYSEMLVWLHWLCGHVQSLGCSLVAELNCAVAYPMQHPETVRALQDMMEAVVLLDPSAQHDALVVARHALMEREDRFMPARHEVYVDLMQLLTTAVAETPASSSAPFIALPVDMYAVLHRIRVSLTVAYAQPDAKSPF